MSQKAYSIEKMQSACRLRQIRENAGLSQEKFAEVLGISLPAYKKVERGENSISLSSLRNLHKTMNVSSDYILYGEMESGEDVWRAILNCTEEYKLVLMFRLLNYFTKTKKGTYPLMEEQREIDGLIWGLIEKLRDDGEK